MLPSPTKLFSTRSVDALASAAGALREAFEVGDFADAFFLLGRLDFFLFSIVVGGECELDSVSVC